MTFDELGFFHVWRKATAIMVQGLREGAGPFGLLLLVGCNLKATGTDWMENEGSRGTQTGNGHTQLIHRGHASGCMRYHGVHGCEGCYRSSIVSNGYA